MWRVASTFDRLSIERTSTADQIARALHEMIVRGELAPGSPLNESILATQLGVSRNTVREGVRVLGQSGLIRQEMHRGAVVRPVDLAEVLDLYRVREVLEVAGVRESRGGDLGEMEAALADLSVAAHANDEARAVEQDLAFHAAIVRFLASPRLDRYFADLCVELRFYLAVISHVDREVEEPEALVEQHAAVLRALRADDRRLAARLLTRHIGLNARRVSVVLTERAA